MNSMPPNRLGPIAFFIPWFRATNETFVSYELLALQKKGVTGEIYYEKINKKNVQPIHKKISFPSHNIFTYPFLSPRGHRWEKIRTHLILLISNPIGYIKAAIFFLRMPIVKYRSLFISVGLVAARLRASKTSLIYIHDGAWMSFVGILCSKFVGSPCGIMFHTEYLFAKPDHLALKIASAGFCIFQSMFSRVYAMRIAHIKRDSGEKLHVIYSPGVDTGFFTPIAKKSINKNRPLRIISIGRLEEMKGYDRLIKAIGLLRSDDVSIDCKIIGYGSMKNDLEGLVKSLQLGRYVRLIGSVSHTKKLLQLMNEADMFVLTSVVDRLGDRDMQPNALKEAMAMELLVITANLGGITEVIKDGENGFLLPSVEPRVVADTIKRVWLLPDIDKRIIQKRARSTVVSEHRLDMITEQLINRFQRESI